jgi:formate transporter
VSHDFGVILLRAIPANWLVCSAIWFAFTAEDVPGKILSCLIPVTAFAAVGFEHCIASMFFVPLGLMTGAKTNFWIFIYKVYLVGLL